MVALLSKTQILADSPLLYSYLVVVLMADHANGRKLIGDGGWGILVYRYIFRRLKVKLVLLSRTSQTLNPLHGAHLWMSNRSPNFSVTPADELEPNMIRASVDLRVPNKYMERSRITQSPIVEDFIHKFHDCKIWTKLDLRQGYHQLKLDPASRAIATFSTPWGSYRPKRLVFGAKASQDLFDETMQKVFGYIPRCLNQRDDIMIGVRDWAEHNATPEEVLQRTEDFGITRNLPKCEFGRRELEFYGYRFSENGLKPTPDKVRSIKECTEPKSKTEVRSFLGMTGYLAKFIPRYASLTKPLRDLTHRETKFH